MEWLNIKIATLRAPEYIGSKPVERATWINVFAYSCEQENGGRLIGATAWKDRQWQQACGVTAREVRAADKLLRVEGDDVVVFAYPVEKQAEVQARRIQAGDAARRRWNEKIGDAPRIPPRIPASDASRIAPRNAEGEGEGESGGGTARARADHAGGPPPPPPPRKFVEEADFSELEKRFPGVNVRAELAAALRYRREKKGDAVQGVELRFFAEDWLPHATPMSEAQQAIAEKKAAATGEPEGWQTWMNENFPGWAYAGEAALPWAQHSELTKKYIRQQMEKGGAL